MKILVFGAGAIGMAFGGFLSRRHTVTLLGRKRHMDAVERNGLRVSGIWGRHCFRRLAVATELAEVRGPVYDLILVTVKAYDTAAAASVIRGLVRPQTLVLSLQNGLGNIEALHARLPRRQVLAGRVIFGVEIRGSGSIHVSVIAHPTAIGETTHRSRTSRVHRIAKAFQENGIPAVAVRDVQGLLWSKVVYNAALNPLASLLRCHYGKLMEEGLTRSVMDEVVREIYRVAHRAGISLKPETPGGYLRNFYQKLVPRTYHHHPSMLQDLEQGKRTEIHAMNGAIVKLGRRYGVKTPANYFLTQWIRRAESL